MYPLNHIYYIIKDTEEEPKVGEQGLIEAREARVESDREEGCGEEGDGLRLQVIN